MTEWGHLSSYPKYLLFHANFVKKKRKQTKKKTHILSRNIKHWSLRENKMGVTQDIPQYESETMVTASPVEFHDFGVSIITSVLVHSKSEVLL